MFMRLARTSAIVALAAVAALTLAACSSSSEEATSTPSAAASAPAESAPAESAPAETATVGTLVDIAAGNPDFSTLAAAVQAAGLVDTLNGAGPFTVFAPTNEAFAALPAGVLDALLLPENKDLLVQILTYHAVSGTVLAADVMAGDVPTVEGQNITLATDGGVTVNGAAVVQADIIASNGVIHVIDAVLLPPGVDAAALATP
jgi:uncharacterized surface protein with fasciclin (FAS1) repeats